MVSQVDLIGARESEFIPGVGSDTQSVPIVTLPRKRPLQLPLPATAYMLSNCPLVAGTPKSHPSDASERVTPSMFTTPPLPPKADLIVLSDHPLEQSTNQPSNLGADIHVTQPIQPLSSSTGPDTLRTTNVQTPNDAQEDGPDLVDVLGFISRSRLTPRERRALAENLVSEERTPSGLARENIVSSPPPYAR